LSPKARKTLLTSIVCIIYYIVLFTLKFTLLENLRLSPANYQISENCVIVHGQATTGPEIRVVEGANYLIAAVPLPHPDDLNVHEIEMTGESIYTNILAYPDYFVCNWLIYGKVVGTTDRYEICGSGTVPIFETEKVYPIMTIAEFITLEVIMFAKFPWGLIAALILYIMPAVVILVQVRNAIALVMIWKRKKSYTD